MVGWSRGKAEEGRRARNARVLDGPNFEGGGLEAAPPFQGWEARTGAFPEAPWRPVSPARGGEGARGRPTSHDWVDSKLK